MTTVWVRKSEVINAVIVEVDVITRTEQLSINKRS